MNFAGMDPVHRISREEQEFFWGYASWVGYRTRKDPLYGRKRNSLLFLEEKIM